MTTRSYQAAAKLIDAMAMRYEATFSKASRDFWAKELEHLSESDLQTAFDRFCGEYESLPYRFSVSAGLLKQLRPTMTAATVEERLYACLQDKDPCAFLERISPKLKKLAVQGNLFDRQLSATDQNFRVKDIARRFMEWQANESKGFKQAEPEGDVKKIEFSSQQMQRIQNPLRGLPISEAAKIAAERLSKKDGGTS